MSDEFIASIMDVDFIFENDVVRIITLRKLPEIELGGLTIGPFIEGAEYEVRFWIAQELERVGVARIREDELLDAVRLYKIQWKEQIQPGTQFSSLPEGFFPKLRRYLATIKREAVSKADKSREYEKTRALSQDIVNCRIKKFVSLSSSSIQTNQLLRNLAREERIIYERLFKVINEWKAKILEGA